MSPSLATRWRYTGALAGLCFFFWLYYASLIFVLGSHIALACEPSSNLQGLTDNRRTRRER
jgi:uncharacterized BrkB/YihY/UPF0761 family membrane protein